MYIIWIHIIKLLYLFILCIVLYCISMNKNYFKTIKCCYLKKKQTLNAIIHHQKVYPTGPSPYERSYSNLCHARTACFPSGQSRLLADSVPLQSLIRVAEKEIQQQIKTKSTKKTQPKPCINQKNTAKRFFSQQSMLSHSWVTATSVQTNTHAWNLQALSTLHLSQVIFADSSRWVLKHSKPHSALKGCSVDP